MTPEEQATFERGRREHILSVRARNSGLTDAFLAGRQTLETFPIKSEDDAEAVAAIRAWLRPPLGKLAIDPNGLYMHGPVGTGKSGLAQCAIAASLVVMPSRYITKVDLIMAVQASFDGEGTSERDEVMKIAKVPRLAIDDIDKGQQSAFVLRVLYALIDYRYRYRLPTIITSNRDQDALYDLLAKDDRVTADAIVDRIREMCEDIPMSGESKR